MANLNLNLVEIKELIERYRSELRKIEFQKINIINAIHELESELERMPAEVISKVETGSVNIKKRRYRTFKRSIWDETLLKSLRTDEPKPAGDLLVAFQEKNEEDDLGLDDKQLRNALSRTLIKLVEKRGAVIKENYPGKGFGYRLAEPEE